jgi:glycosyltransferase involved in cell wall biosynthesis
MSTVPAARRIIVFDPGSFVPYYVDSLCRGLAARGQRPRVVASPPLFEPVDSGGSYDVDWYFFPFLRGIVRDVVRHRVGIRQALKGIAYPLGLWRTWRALRVGAPGVFHLQWMPVPLLDRLLVRALRSRGWRIVYTEHDPLPLPERRARRRHHCEVLAMCDAVIVHTLTQREELTRAVPDVADRVHVIPHGGTPVAVASAAERALCRAHLGIDRDRPVILFFGLIKPYKGLPHLLAAMPSVVAAFPRALLLIAGEPLMPLSAIERQIDALGLREHVSLRLGFVPANEVSTYLNAADLLVAPYVNVGASGVVVMAQGHGLPVVVTRVGGLPEFVEPDDCGFVVAPGSPAALADAIRTAFTDRAALARMGERAWRRLARENDWADVAERTMALYEGPTSLLKAADARRFAGEPVPIPIRQ